MATDAPVPLEQYLQPLRNHKILIVVVAALVAGLGYFASTLVPVTYRSTASILVTPISADPTSTFESDVEVGMATEERIATSVDVVEQVADRLANESVIVTNDELADNVTVSSPKDSRILDVSYVATTPANAQLGAETFATTYLEYRSQLANEDKEVVIESLRERVETLQDEISQLAAEQAQFETDSEPYIAAVVEREAVKSELDAQQDALARLSTLSVEVGRVISPAELPTGPEGLSTPVVIFGSIVAGLILGCLAAFVRAALKAGSTSSAAVASNGVAPYEAVSSDERLKDLFASDLWQARDSGQLSLPAASNGHQHHPMSEPDFEALVTRLRRSNKGSISAVCFGHTSREASIATGLGLAVSLQSSGSQVLVIDLLLEAPALDGLLDIPSDPGLLDVLAGSMSLKRAQHALPSMGNIRALTVGNDDVLSDRDQTDELVNGWGMRRLLAESAPLFDATIFIGGTLSDAGRLDLVVRAATGLVIGTEQPAGRPADADLADALASVPGRPLGLISLNEALAARANGGTRVPGS